MQVNFCSYHSGHTQNTGIKMMSMSIEYCNKQQKKRRKHQMAKCRPTMNDDDDHYNIENCQIVL